MAKLCFTAEVLEQFSPLFSLRAVSLRFGLFSAFFLLLCESVKKRSGWCISDFLMPFFSLMWEKKTGGGGSD